MVISSHPMKVLGTVCGLGLMLSLVGCDYWPPALQAQIEQLRSEIQTLTMEKTQLQAQVSDFSKTRQELQGQVDELSRMNREKMSMITGLQNQLDATRARALKAMSPKTPTHKATAKSTAKPAAKSATKTTPKTTVTKKPASKTAGVR